MAIYIYNTLTKKKEEFKQERESVGVDEEISDANPDMLAEKVQAYIVEKFNL